jgi:hypothetical protein
MSSVRMCDNAKCRNLFSENDDGWSTDSRNVQRRNPDGSMYTVRMQIDLCATCVGTEDGTVTSPRLAEAPGTLPRPGGLAGEISAAEAEDTRADVTLLKLRMDEVELRLNKNGGLQYHGPNCPGHTAGTPAPECVAGLVPSTATATYPQTFTATTGGPR